MSRPAVPGKVARGSLSARAMLLIVLCGFAVLSVLMQFSEPGGRGYRTYQGGLLTCAIAGLATLPVRYRMGRRERERRDLGKARDDRYLGSDRCYFDVCIAVSLLVLTFIVDRSMLPAAGFRVGVASAIGIVVTLAAGFVSRRRRGKG